MTFIESCIKLGIEDYAEQIFKSSNTGTLYHIPQYIAMAKCIPNPEEWFRSWWDLMIDATKEDGIPINSFFLNAGSILVELDKHFNHG